VMDRRGKKLTEGTPEEVGSDPKVLEVYLVSDRKLYFRLISGRILLSPA
ncbi:MAG TPA: hypothetical protein ENH65_13325, partial [Candidatus Aminicenantes bacterium]|nr:hypothetical protein [Candidatus Aminicenantes bacterium]